MTLRCMQALVRVQARVRARRVRMSIEGQAVQKMLEEHRGKLDPLKEAEVEIFLSLIKEFFKCWFNFLNTFLLFWILLGTMV